MLAHLEMVSDCEDRGVTVSPKRASDHASRKSYRYEESPYKKVGLYFRHVIMEGSGDVRLVSRHVRRDFSARWEASHHVAEITFKVR